MVILPMLTYGASILPPSSKYISTLQKTWNSVLQWVTNCFRSTPSIILSAEVCFSPLALYMQSLHLQFVASIAHVSPASNPVTTRFPSSFTAISPFRVQSNCALLHGCPDLPKPWNSKFKRSVPLLPIDQVLNLLVPFLDKDFQIYLNAKEAHSLLIKQWKDTPLPPYYTFTLLVKLDLFMNFDRFIAG